MTYISNFQDKAKAGLTGKFIALNAYIRKEESSQIINLSFHLIKNKNKLNPKQVEGKKQ